MKERIKNNNITFIQKKKRLVPSKLIIDCIFSGLLAFSIIWLLYAYKGYAPFGNNSLASMDANIQYLDFFAWLKNILLGKDNISYTFTKVLGGNSVGIYSYYLASPFSLLVAFFPKSQLHTFFDLVVSLKLATAAIMCTVFLYYRFEGNGHQNIWRRMIYLLLAVAYALGQYSIAQSSNVPWLDGVYMLPLILLGVFRLVRKKSGILLAVSVGCSILFNWYTGGINCLFAIIWFLFEIGLYITEKTEKHIPGYKLFWHSALQFCMWMIIGVMISGILFLPTIGAMRKSIRGSLELGMLKNTSFIGNILTVIEAYVPGATSALGTASLYAGSLPLLGCIGFFLSHNSEKKKKCIYAILLTVTLLLFYWNPLYALFSLLKWVSSYWYRFSYVGIFTLIFIAADHFEHDTPKDIQSHLFSSAAIYSFLIMLFSYIKGVPSADIASKTVILVSVCSLSINSCIQYQQNGKFILIHNKKFTCVLMVLLFMMETGYGVSKQMNNYHASDVSTFSAYTVGEEKQISSIKNQDSGYYRISQTSTRNMESLGLTAYYNEGMAYNYWSISGYTSSPDTAELEFLERIGYRQNSENYCITNSPVIGADSLLGVKYILSKYPISGMTLRSDLPIENEKAVYENPYALPMAFMYSANDIGLTADGKNPFEYENNIYSQLLGKKVELYTPVDYSTSIEKDGSLHYTISIPDGNTAIYGNLPWNDDEYDWIVDVNHQYQTQYARWGSPSAFYIPVNQHDKTCSVSIKSDNKLYINGKEQFYSLNLDMLGEVAAELKSESVSKINITNKNVNVEADAPDNNTSLFISVPYDNSWKIIRNGNIVKPKLVGDCLYSIPLEKGHNSIKMMYQTDNSYAGIVCTAGGLLLLMLINYFQNKNYN